jgi:hypothetical protein
VLGATRKKRSHDPLSTVGAPAASKPQAIAKSTSDHVEQHPAAPKDPHRLSLPKRIFIGTTAMFAVTVGWLGVARGAAWLGASNDAPKPSGVSIETIVDPPPAPTTTIVVPTTTTPPPPAPESTTTTAPAPPTTQPPPPTTAAPAPAPAPTREERLQALKDSLPYADSVAWQIVPYDRFGHWGIYCPLGYTGSPPCDDHTIYIADVVFDRHSDKLRSVASHELAHAVTMAAYYRGDQDMVDGVNAFAAKYSGGNLNDAFEKIADSVCTGWGECSWRHYVQNPPQQMIDDALKLVRPVTV